ncbi:thiamine pyrophosphokinase 1 [Cherax quadricarinatus]
MENGDGKLCWKPKEYYHPSPGLQYGIVLLNEAVNKTNVHYVSFLWQHASVRVCVDGAINAYHKLMRCQNTSFESSCCTCPLPEIITGDFDSAKSELLKLYSTLGVNVVPTPSQEETDFTKAIRVLGRFTEERSLAIEHVTVIAGLRTERFDHVIANIATLYKVEMLISVPVVIVCGGSIYWLLAAGDHSIQVAEDIIFNPQCSWCGLVPVGQPSTVTTTGLKWNLNNQVLAFGHVVSTSNTFDPICYGVVTVTTSQPLLWTMGWDIEHAPTLQEIEDHTSSRFPSKGTSEVNCLGCPTSTHGN